MKTVCIPYVGSAEPSDSVLAERGAHATIGTVNWAAFAYRPYVEVHAAYTDTHLWLRYEVRECNIKAVCTIDNGRVWEDSCVEFFAMHADGVHYMNFEFNCIGTSLAAVRTSRSDAQHLTAEQLAQIVRHTSLPHTPIDLHSDGTAWSLTVGIPFTLMGFDSAPERLRANLYKCGDATAVPHYVSWNAIATAKPDFHRPEFFGEFVFANKQ